ncbi:putative ATPase involved in DNA repair (fragment) [Candidatus Glomeribacter gigasporarum BEG34]|uniref:Putative ATPase involved in DNA repair n=1 Tax=Candidatus Glomeribacter gigasporarum BEG34 TaxID=1070319 RepID=G2JBJ9_9BURK
MTNASWLPSTKITLNPGLVAVIGARGSGKTALADLIAAGGFALSPHLNDKSFIRRAKDHLDESEVQLEWTGGEKTGNHLAKTDREDWLDTQRVQYLSQQFVDQLCSAEGLDDALVGEIERVIFNAHPITDRLNVDSFKELLAARLETSRQKRQRHHQNLIRASADLTEERIKKDGLKTLEKVRDEKQQAIDRDKAARKSLIGSTVGNKKRTRRLEQVSLVVDKKRQQLEYAKRQHQTLLQLKEDVRYFREQQAPTMLAELQNTHKEVGLSPTDWKAFKLDYVGNIGLLLEEHIRKADTRVRQLQGSEQAGLAQQALDPNVPLISQEANLTDQPLLLLERELARLRAAVGINQQNIKRHNTFSDNIAKAEVALDKMRQRVEHIRGADGRIRALCETRQTAYAGIFEAIIEEQETLAALYAPIKSRIGQAEGSLSKLSFSVKRSVALEQWANAGEALLDLRTSGPFKGCGELLRIARDKLMPVWATGNAEAAAAALNKFVETNRETLIKHRPEGSNFRDWARQISDWLYSTDHITVGYGLQYDGVDIERLSPGTRGIVLLLLYLAIDAEDSRPLIIDQPEENLDPQSIFQELVCLFREAKKRRQIIIVTHNANLVVNTDADQVIVATCKPRQPGELPSISYQSGGFENSNIRHAVCSILEGGEQAFRERAKRLRVTV